VKRGTGTCNAGLHNETDDVSWIPSQLFGRKLIVYFPDVSFFDVDLKVNINVLYLETNEAVLAVGRQAYLSH
jgi:hypothetical protein